jgi:hypothetical protein
VLVGLAAIALFAADASAMYNPSTGTFLQRDQGSGDAMGVQRVGVTGPITADGFLPRDPTGQYQDGMNLYQYARSAPTVYTDPDGRLVILLHGAKVSNYGFGESIAQSMKDRIKTGINNAEDPVIAEPAQQGDMWTLMDKVATKNESDLSCREPIIIIGYSDGATVLRLLTLDFAAKHPKENIDYVGVIDMVRDSLDQVPLPGETRYSRDLGRNILAGSNWYQRNDVVFGVTVPLKGARISTPPTVKNRDLSGMTVRNSWVDNVWPWNWTKLGVHPISHLDIIQQDVVQQGAVIGAVEAWKKGYKAKP